MKPRYIAYNIYNLRTGETSLWNSKILRTFLLGLIGLFIATSGFSQQDEISFSPINDGSTFDTCNGFIIDSGGQGGPGYSNDENFTITVCPDTIGEGDNSLYITTTFNLFDLDGTNTGTQQNPNVDFMAVYDGPDASYPSLGSYNTDELQGVSIAATTNNGSGCLTFVFYSNSQGTGQFTASATCTQPCVPPVADAFIVDGATPDSIALCIGEEVTFDGTGSTAANGFSIEEYSWNFIDGTVDNTTGPVITHSFDAPGYYDVQLTVTDDNPDNECQNLNSVPLKVFVSNYPTYSNFPEDTTLCLGDELDLTGITPGPDGFGQYDSTWTGFPGSNAIDDGCLPDTLLGISQSIPVTYSEFDPSATIESVDDIISICLNMEHSFMGDLIIQLSCPDGTTINLQEQEGGGTQIGEPDPADSVDCVNGTGIGEGYDYCWDDDADETWLEWVQANNPPDNTLASGTYQPADPLSDLIGCPLQGTWQITVIDNWAIDDGTIFEFGVTFAPEFYPDIIEFTNTVGEGADSSFWDLGDPYIIDNTSDLNQITIAPEELGTFEYNYQVVNNFGCEFDSTVTVDVIDGPEITAGPDIQVCEDPVLFQAGMANANPPECSEDAGNYTYCYEDDETLTVTYCPDNPGDGNTFMEFVINSGTVENFFDEMTVYDGDNTGAPIIGGPVGGDLSGQSFSATNNGNGCITFEIVTDGSESCASGVFEELDISVSCNNGGNNLVWSWSPTTGLSNPNIQNPTVLVDQATTYTVSAYSAQYPGCVTTDQVDVVPDPAVDPGIDTDTTICYNLASGPLTDYLNGTPVSGGTWTDASGNEFPGNFTPSNYPDGQSFSLTYTVTNGTCEGTSNLNLTVLPSDDPTCCQTSADAGPDTIACALSVPLQAGPVEGYGVWSGPSEVQFSDTLARNANVSTSAPGGVYELYWTDYNGLNCSETDTVEVVLSEPVTIDTYSVNALCKDSCSGRATALASGGLIEDDYTYNWFDAGVVGSIPQLRDSLCAGVHEVIITDDFGCDDTTSVTIGEPGPITVDVLTTRPSCFGDCDGELEIVASRGSEFSFDGGVSFQSSKFASNLCPGEYSIVVRDENGCQGYAEAQLVEPAKFIADFSMNPNPTTTKKTEIEFTNLAFPRPVATSEWKFAPLQGEPFGESSEFNPTYTFPSDTSGTYEVLLSTVNSYGCRDSITKILEIYPNLRVFVPNSFTPDGDGLNDIFRPVISIADFDEYTFEVYDRWGSRIFKTSDPDEGWNGTLNDGDYLAPAGVYTYKVVAVSATDQEKREVFGYVNLIR